MEYDLEEDQEAPTEIRNIDHIFRDERITTSDEQLAASSGNWRRRENCRNHEPASLERVPRVPRVTEFYKVERGYSTTFGGRYTWSRKFLGTYAQNLSLESK
jgi:hypothetical protein